MTSISAPTIPVGLQRLFEDAGFIAAAQDNQKPAIHSKTFTAADSTWDWLWRRWKRENQDGVKIYVRRVCEEMAQALVQYEDSAFYEVILAKMIALRTGVFRIAESYRADVSTKSHMDDSILILDFKIPENIKIKHGFSVLNKPSVAPLGRGVFAPSTPVTAIGGLSAPGSAAPCGIPTTPQYAPLPMPLPQTVSAPISILPQPGATPVSTLPLPISPDLGSVTGKLGSVGNGMPAFVLPPTETAETKAAEAKAAVEVKAVDAKVAAEAKAKMRAEIEAQVRAEMKAEAARAAEAEKVAEAEKAAEEPEDMPPPTPVGGKAPLRKLSTLDLTAEVGEDEFDS